MAVEYTRRKITVEEFNRMADQGTFDPDRRVELINGEITPMSEISIKQNAAVNRLNRLFTIRFGERATVQIRGSVVLSEFSEVRPDLALLHWDRLAYDSRAPEPDDVFLIIEASDTTSDDDRLKRQSLYAQSGIREFWLVDLKNDTISIHQNPVGATYANVRIAVPGDLACTAFPDDSFPVERIIIPTLKPEGGRTRSDISRNETIKRSAI